MLDFLPCLGGLAIATASRLARSLTQAWTAFCAAWRRSYSFFDSLAWWTSNLLCDVHVEQFASNYQYILRIS